MTTPIGQASGMALQTDGKIVVVGAGDSQPGLGWAPVIARYLADGSLDPSFGSGGSVELPHGIGISRIVVGPDGTIVGAATIAPFDFSTSQMAVVRLTPSGALDTSFGSGGVAPVPFPGKAYAEDVVLQPDGKIVVVGGTIGALRDLDNAAVARVNADGSTDTSFGGGTVVVTDFSGSFDSFQSVVLLSNGEIIAGGTAGSEYGLARYSTTGALDLTFGSGGKAVAAFPGGDASIHDMALQPDGRIVAVGSLGDGGSATIPSGDITAARFLADGSLDPSFGTSGTFRFGRGYPAPGIGSDEVVQALALQPDGKILVAGGLADNGNAVASFLVGRLKATGSWDTTYGGGTGFVTTSFRSSTAAYGAALQSDGKLVVAGLTGGYSTFPLSFALARYLGDTVVPPPTGGGGGGGGGASVPDLSVGLVANGSVFAPGAEADLVATVTNRGGAGSLQTHLLIDLPSTMTLLGPPAYDRGSGCSGSQKIDCNLDYIPNGDSTKVVFAVRVSGSGAQQITATASSDREANPADNSATLTLQVTAPQAPLAPPSVAKPVFGKPLTQPLVPVAGKRFTFTLAVKRSDTGAPLRTGRMVCDPTVAGKPVKHVESFTGGKARLSLLVPKAAKGKQIKIKIKIVSGSQSTTKVVTYKVN